MSKEYATPNKSTKRPKTSSFSMSSKKRYRMQRTYKHKYANKLHLSQHQPFESIYNVDFKRHRDPEQEECYNVNKHGYL